MRAAFSLGVVILFLAEPARVAAERPYPVTEEREACSDFDPLRKPLFGDTHVHTSFSHDASTQDNRHHPRDAYRFARGERLPIQPYDAEGNGLRSAQLARPLDWTALSDHSEMLGEVRICADPEHPEYDSDICWNKRNAPFPMLTLTTRPAATGKRHKFCGPDGKLCTDAAIDAWREIRDAAEEAYDRSAACRFTSLIGYEWTSSVASNLHRNVVFRNHLVPDYAQSSFDTRSAFRLFELLEQECVDGIASCDAIVIPHNSNISLDGFMFKSARLASVEEGDIAIDREEARLRARFERQIEIMQHKGDSECLLGGDTTDEACGFEKLPFDSMIGVFAPADPPKRSAMVRSGLRKGIALEKQLGINPLKYGVIASTDTHLGTPGLVKEDEALGHGGASRVMSPDIPAGIPDFIHYNPGGLAVVWAEENARDSIFEALFRKETYGTSGTRPVVRFFGGWDYDDGLCDEPDLAKTGYARGVPMGGDLPERPEGAKAPRFVVSALQDPAVDRGLGRPLQRVQIVKGWTDGDTTHEKVYDVAGSENGASVDLRTCEPQGEGAASLCTVWQDPDFEAGENAFYYARVLENPTCRWHQHLCAKARVDCSKPETVGPGLDACCDDDLPRTVQERAWTSPIWYSAN